MPEMNPAQALNEAAAREGWPMRADAALQFETPQLNALREVWRAKAKDAGDLPARGAFDARTLKPFLSHISIVERAVNPSGQRSYRFRFYGTELTRYFGEQTTHFIEDSIPPERLDSWVASFDAVLSARAPLRILSYFEIPQVSYLNGESFTAPFANGAHAPSTILAATYFTPKSASRAVTA
jgi:hypothetical protein